MATQKKNATIVNKFGLHARPAMQLVELANRYNSQIQICNAALTVDAKSIMSVMRLAATKGTVLQFVADGSDSAEAIDALIKLVDNGFGED